MVGSSDGGTIENVSLSGNLLSRLKSMRGKKSGIIFGAVLAGAICSIIFFLFFISILGFILIAIIGVVVPYLMGLKKLAHILVYGVALLVVLSFVFAGSYVHYVYLVPSHVSQDSHSNSTTGFYFKDGSVTPTKGDGNTVFTFNAQMYHPSNVSGNPTVYVVLDTLLGVGSTLNATMTPVSNTTHAGGSILTSYVYSTTLPNKELFGLQYKSNISGKWVMTTATVSPWTSTPSNTFVSLIEPSFRFVLISVFILFFGLELIIYLMVKSRIRRDQMLKARLERDRSERGGERPGSESTTRSSERKLTTKKEKFICTSCGTEVSKDDKVCPKCGEKFD